MSEKKQQVSRRQFLNYTLTGVGGFMAAGMLVPMLGMAVDPLLTKAKSGELANAGFSVDDLTNEPQRVEWKVDQVDAWYESKITKTAYVYKNDKGDIVALSSICTHLGCTVAWEGNEKFPEQFYCPCHGGRYTKDGVNIPGTPPPAPLDVYEQKVEKGMLFLGNAHPRGEA